MTNERKYEIMEKIVNSGNSKVFKNWQKYGLITKDEFLEALKWIAGDEKPEGAVTRDIALDITKDMEQKIINETCDNEAFHDDYDENNLKGKIIKLHRVWSDHHEFVAFYNEDGYNYGGNGRHFIHINIDDKI